MLAWQLQYTSFIMMSWMCRQLVHEGEYTIGKNLKLGTLTNLQKAIVLGLLKSREVI